ncbi:MAG TPA: hypothetical protein VMT94_05035 [Burkholderiales bacterium]|nr:hypothetical protein [Burkholderiales bacterium]
MAASKIRVGIFAQPGKLPRWIARAIDSIVRSEFAEVVLYAEVRPVAEPSMPWLFRLYRAIDFRLFGTGLDPLQPTELNLPPGADRLWLRPGDDGGIHPEDAARIKDCRLDVALWLIDTPARAGLAALARHGMWELFVGAVSAASVLAGFWEVMLARPQTISGIRVPAAGATGLTIYRSSARTFPYSFRRNQENVLRKTAEFAYRKLRDLHYDGAAAIAKFNDAMEADDGSPLPSSPPGNVRMTLLLIGLLSRIAQRAIQKLLFVDQWVLAYKFGGDADAMPSPSGFTHLLPPRDRFWADPFPVEKDGHYFVFFEELMFATGKGHISVIEIDAAGRWTSPVKVLEEKHHLSYPFVFEWDGVHYMIPESSEKRCVELYRCVRFPDQWALDRVLIDNIRAVDATLCAIDGLWWMFVNVSPEGVEIYDELHIYYADSPLGPWLPHQRNPVVSDMMRARPAGRLFERNGRWLRPAQICAPIYGAGLSINRIIEITPEKFVEEEIQQIYAETETIGIHTWNEAGLLKVCDYFVRRL